MNKIKYLFVLMIGFLLVGVVNAQDIAVDDLINYIKNQGANAEKTDAGIVVTENGQARTYYYNSATNLISYDLTDSDGTTVDAVINNSKMVHWIVPISSNYSEYDNLKNSKGNINVDYGSGCDLTNMGVCYNPTDKKLQISLSDTFTTYLIAQYNGDIIDNNDDFAKGIEESTYAEGEAPAVAPTETVTGEASTQDSKNPETGSFAEYGIVIALALLLLVVIILKKRNETEYTI